jgi:predicted nucleotidyltransferase
MSEAIVSDARVQAEVASHPYRLLFSTVSGAHLYGFPSPNSDVDLRGVHILPPSEVLGLDTGPETITLSHVREALEVDLVTHDAKKFFTLLLRRNGYVLEQLCSPLLLHTTPQHQALLALVPGLVTRHHAHHYLGFAATEWRLLTREPQPRIKPLLYVYRVLLTGINLMRTGEVEANLPRLNEVFRLPFIPELIERKTSGVERAELVDVDMAFHQQMYEQLVAELEVARDTSALPDKPSARRALHEILLQVRGVTPTVR